MRTNGILQYTIQEGGGVNESGEPIPAKSYWSAPITCSIQTNNHNNKGTYQDGKFTTASYEILIESLAFSAIRVKLSRYGENLGEFEVQDIQPFPGVGRIKILV